MIEGEEGAAEMPSSEELFASAVADEPVEKTPEPIAEESKDRTRDEHGRFKAKQPEESEEPKAEEPAEQPATTAEEPKTEPAPVNDKAPGPVPYDRFREVIEQNRQLMALLQRQPQPQQQTQEQPAEPVDPVSALFEDPDGYLAKQVDARTAALQQQLEDTRVEFSRFRAAQIHGQEAVNAAYDALNGAINEGRINRDAALAALKKSPDPFGEIVKWHEQELDRSDPARAIKRQLEAMSADQRAALLSQFGSAPAAPVEQEQPSHVVKLPPSINRQPGASGNASASGDMSHDAIFRHAVGK